MQDHSDVQAPYFKAFLAWLGVVLGKMGIHQWSDVAAFLASIYSLFLIIDWCWKKFGRAHARRRGWIK